MAMHFVREKMATYRRTGMTSRDLIPTLQQIRQQLRITINWCCDGQPEDFHQQWIDIDIIDRGKT